MPPARRSSTTKSTARSAGKSTARSASGTAARATRGVRARAASTSAATRREVEQSISRFEKRLDDAGDALSTLGKHLGRGGQSSYKEVTAALRALRREAGKTNKQALKDFDKLRSAVTKSNSSATRSSRKTSGSTSAGSTTASKTTARKSTARKATARKTSAAGSRAASSRTTSSRKTASRSRAKKS
jgi:hypothetical protein